MIRVLRSRRLAKSILLAGVAAGAAFGFMPGPAWAACGTGTGNGNGGTDYEVSAAETGPCPLNANDSLHVTFSGSLTGGGSLVNVTGAALRIDNDALISTDGTGGIAVDLDPGASLSDFFNTGTTQAMATDTIARNNGTINNLVNYGLMNADAGGFGFINNGTITAFQNAAGTISGVGNITLDNAGTITNLANTGQITTQSGNALVNSGTLTLDNTNGTISAVTGQAIVLNAGLTGTLENGGGLITSASTGNGTFVISADVGAQTIRGGTLSNTGTANSSVAVNITAPQNPSANAIFFDGVSLIADGDTPGSGHAIAVQAGANPVSLAFTNGTVIRGNITGSARTDIFFSNIAMTGNIALGAGNDTLFLFGPNASALAGSINFGTGTNTLTVTSSFTTQGTIGSATTLNTSISGIGSLTVNNAMALGNGTLSNSAALYLNGANITTTGLFTNSGTTRIGLNRTLSAGSFAAGTPGALTYNVNGVNRTLTTGTLNVGASAANFTNQTVRVVYAGGLIDASTRSLIATGTGAASLPVNTIADSSYLYDFSVVQGAGGLNNNLYLAATQQSLAAAALSQNNAAISDVLINRLAGSADPVIQQIQTNLGNAPTRQAYNDVLESAGPVADNGAPTAAIAFAANVFDLADTQMAIAGPSGISTGNAPARLQPWIQGFGQTASQDSRGGISGYDSRIYGGALGLNLRDPENDTVMGLSFAYGQTDVDSKSSSAAETDIDTYQITTYGNHDLGGDYFVTGMAAFGWSKNDQTRHNVGGIAGLNASADYDSWHGAGRIEAGRNFRSGGAFAGAVLTPVLSADYVHYKADGYSETGAGGASLSAGERDENVLDLGVGLRAQWLLQSQSGLQSRPEIHVRYHYNVLDDDSIDTSASFAAGGGAFSTNGLDPANGAFDIGAGVTLHTAGSWDLTAKYDLTVKSDYTANTGTMRASYKF